MTEKAPKIGFFDISKDAFNVPATVRKGLAQVPCVIIVVPAFGGPLAALLHRHNVKPPARQWISDHMTPRRHPNTCDGVRVFNFHQSPPSNLARKEGLCRGVYHASDDRMQAVCANSEIGFDLFTGQLKTAIRL